MRVEHAHLEYHVVEESMTTCWNTLQRRLTWSFWDLRVQFQWRRDVSDDSPSTAVKHTSWNNGHISLNPNACVAFLLGARLSRSPPCIMQGAETLCYLWIYAGDKPCHQRLAAKQTQQTATQVLDVLEASQQGV